MKKRILLFIMMIVLTMTFVGVLGCSDIDPRSLSGVVTDGVDDPTDDDTPNDPTDDDTPDKPSDDKPTDDDTPNKPSDDPTGDDTPNKPSDDKPTGDDTPNKPSDDKPTDDDTPNKPSDDKPYIPAVTEKGPIKLYYTDSEGWGSVYAYAWNYATGAANKTWPGEKLEAIGTSGFGEKQYSVEVDSSLYDRIIFNDGSGRQTADLAVSAAANGYYGKDGSFTMGTEDYGSVEYFTLTDAQNLNYIAGGKKKISVYTPSGYSAAKKYGVLYMFDSQNLYAGAAGAEKSHDSYGSWAVDVAINNLVKNGKDGFIIVAVDTTDGHRDSELTMSRNFGTLTSLADNDDFKNGKLDNLGDFMKNTLRPWVNSHYSVYTDRSMTGIAGSSSGGLAAYYLGLRDNDVYGYIGAFSPANGLFTAKDWENFYSRKDFSKGKPKVYVYCGYGDGGLEDKLVPSAREVKLLKNYGFDATSVTENYVSGATHSENYWRVAFMDFLGKTAPIQ